MAESDAVPSSMGLGRSRIRDVDRKLASTLAVLRERERELLELKGPCSNKACPLHYAHAGPCGGASRD